MKIDQVLAKANEDLKRLAKENNLGNKILIDAIIETIQKVCGHKTANELVIKYKLQKYNENIETTLN